VGAEQILRQAAVKRGLAIALVLAAGAAQAERLPTAVVWLGEPGRAAEEVERGLRTARDVRPLDDEAVKRLLIEGGPLSRVKAKLGDGELAKVDAAVLREARERLLREVPTEAAYPLLTRIGAVLDGRGGEAAYGPAPSPVKVTVESEPPGALVYVDLAPVGRTPVALPPERQPYRWVDIELQGFRKVHREGTPPPGTLAVALARDDGTEALVDAIRGANGDAPESSVAELGRRVGAGRVLVARVEPGKADKVQLRMLDVAKGVWGKPAISIAISEVAARVTGYAGVVAEGAPAPAGKVAGAPAATAAAAGKPADPVPAWKRWYTWVAGGVLVSLVIGLVLVNHIGNDSLTVMVSH
jgi:hypothetical protein